MATRTAAGDGSPVDVAVELSAAAAFALVWRELAAVLGTAGVAAIVRRAIQRAASSAPELAELAILRTDLEYGYVLPPAWSETDHRVVTALRKLIGEIGALLVELTGTVLVHRMEQIPELRTSGFVWRAQEPN